MENKIYLNGKIVTEQELNEAREQANLSKGMRIVEIAPNEYRLKLEE